MLHKFVLTFHVNTEFGKRRDHAIVLALNPQDAIEKFKERVPGMGYLWGSHHVESYSAFLVLPIEKTRFAKWA